MCLDTDYEPYIVNKLLNISYNTIGAERKIIKFVK